MPNLTLTCAIQRFPTSLVLRTAALSFYESALALPLELDLPVIVLPSPAFTYICLLAGEVMSVSRICGIVARCAAFPPSEALADWLTPRDSQTPRGAHWTRQRNRQEPGGEQARTRRVAEWAAHHACRCAVAAQVPRGRRGDGPPCVRLSSRSAPSVFAPVLILACDRNSETIALLNKAGEGRSQQVANSQSVTTHGALAVLARDCLSVRPSPS